jgi:hypothetical protein
MQHDQAAWKSSIGHAYTKLKTLAFPPAEWIWALEPGFQWFGTGRKKADSRYFLSRSALSLFYALFRVLVFLLLRARVHESEKKVRWRQPWCKGHGIFFSFLRTIPHRRIVLLLLSSNKKSLKKEKQSIVVLECLKKMVSGGESNQ